VLHVTTSNRFEVLLEALVEALAHAPADPFESQQVIVPSKAVQRKIELALADRLRICANVQFSYLGAWLWRQMGRLVSVAEDSPFAPPVLAWRIYAQLGEATFVGAHPRLAHYLAGADARMRYELAQRIAHLFDQYITYRQDWLEAWTRNEEVPLGAGTAARAGEPSHRVDPLHGVDQPLATDQTWQAALWRHLAATVDARRAHPSHAFFEALRVAMPADLREAGIPATVHVFGLPAMPPLYLEVLSRLARYVEVHLAVLNPCEQYWQDIVDARRLGRLVMQGRADYHEVGNRLLASWGKQQQAQMALLLDAGDAQLEDQRFERNPSDTMLARVQNAILELHDLGPGSLAGIDAADRSIEVHVCHSRSRELEALHDTLLALFAADDPPAPGDVLVVTPDLDEAAPLVDAVFGTAGGKRHIPYRITGRGRSAANPAARALLDLLAVASSRFAASAVMDLLLQPLIARRFGIGAAELGRIREWVRDAGIRWGADARHRELCGVPAEARHSFADGLDRLFLGYALPSARTAQTTPFGSLLPAGDAQGTDALALGSFARFVESLDALRRDLLRPRTVAEWTRLLLDVLATLLEPAFDEVEDVREVQAEIGRLHAIAQAAGVQDAVPVEVMRVAVEAALDDPARGGVPTGAVTFSAMASLRNLPYRVICVIGLDDGAFPGTARPAEFDLLAASPRPGDRQRRADDRNVFLDLLLAARERFYLSYVGRSVRDNAPMAPSVLVAELLDVLVPARAPEGAPGHVLAEARKRLVVEHPLQPFALDCFTSGDRRVRSFNAEYCEALAARSRADPQEPRGVVVVPGNDFGDDDGDEDDAPTQAVAPFFAAPLALDGDAHRSVTLDQLVRFFCNPAAALLRLRLGIRLDEMEEELQDDEPMVAEWPQRQALARRLLPALLQGCDIDAARALARAGTEYPPGRLGERLLEGELVQLAAFAHSLMPDLAPACLAPVERTSAVMVGGHAWQVSAAFSDLRRGGLVRYRYDDVRAADYLEGWLRHVLLNVLAPTDVVPATTWHSRDGAYRLPPIDDAQARLAALLGWYERGLRAPLHFHPKSAWEFAKSRKVERAARKWHGSPGFGGEKDHRARRLALRGVANPLDTTFEQCASDVFAPLLAVIVDARIER
jgi:exodeoxyribonuclease V gamma subunit